MKKLMVAMVSAASAIFAFGELPHGADFEANDYVVGESFTNYLDKADDGVSTAGDRYWGASSGSEEIGSIAAYTGPGPVGEHVVPDIYTNAASNYKYLQLDSGKNRLYRKIVANDDVDNPTGVEMSGSGEGVYLDTLVKLSAASSPVADSDFESADKLAIAYVGELDDGNYLSNFVIRAGFIGSGLLVPTNYLATVDNFHFNAESWYRLTIRTLTNIDGNGRAGFKIYIDEKPMVYLASRDDFAKSAGIPDSAHTIFPSAVDAGQPNAGRISAVAFSGSGGVDDVVFTTTKPQFIGESEPVVATFSVDSGVTAISVQVGSAEPIVVDMNNLSAILPPGTAEFTVTATIDGANDYTFARMTYNNGVFTTNPATINGYTDGVIAITTTRNNFSLFYENGDPIPGTYTTLGAALAAQDVAKIQLAYDYTVADWEDNFAGYTIDQNIVLDLNGKTINGGSSNSKCMFAVGNGYTLTVVNSVDSDNGKIVYGGTAGVFDGNDGDVMLGSTSVTDYGLVVDGAVMGERGFVTCIYRGKFLAALNSTEGNEFICDTDDESGIQVVDGDSKTSLAGAYWVVAPKGGSDWPQPTEDTPAAVEDALEADGFSTDTDVVTTKAEYEDLIAYVETQTGASSPADLTEAAKANAVLCFALQADVIPADEIVQDDITIDAIETGDDGAVDLTVAIDGVEVGASVLSATLAKVVTAKGGVALGSMSTENVTVSGHAVEAGKIKITVTPKVASPESFFTSVIINK